MMYLAEKAGRFYPQDIRRRYEVNQWVMWQMANQGPKLGECGHFLRLGDKQGDQSYAVRRFTDEANRLYGVLNNRLYDRRYLAGDEYTIADMISYPWTVNWKGQRQNIDEFKYFKRWFEELSARPAVQRGLAVTAGPTEDPETLIARRARAPREAALQPARPARSGRMTETIGRARWGGRSVVIARSEATRRSSAAAFSPSVPQRPPASQCCHCQEIGAVSALVRLSSGEGGAK